MKDPLNLLPITFVAGVVVPFIFGFGISFWIVGKTRRLSWVVPSIVIWFAASWLMAFFVPAGMNLVNLFSAWIVAITLIALAYAWRRMAIRAKQRTEASQF